MGKVGSSSVHDSLRRIGVDVIHTHDHNEAKTVINNENKLVIISGIRDLLSRTISAYFENISNNNNQWWYLGDREYIREKGVAFLINQFKDRCVSHIEKVIFPWFDIFSANLQFNIYQKPFNSKLGFESYKENSHVIIVYRLENINSISMMINQYTNNKFELMSSNVAEIKWYADLYRDFINQIWFTKSEIDYFYNNKIMNFFYTHSEKQEMVNKRNIQ